MMQWMCRAIGVCLLSLGIWGFTAEHSYLVFQVNPVHHILEVVAGAAALWAGWLDEKAARKVSLASGAAFGSFAVLGFANVPAIVDVLGLNRADHWLHLLVGGAFLAIVIGSRTAFATDHGTRRIRGIPTPGGSPGM